MKTFHHPLALAVVAAIAGCVADASSKPGERYAELQIGLVSENFNVLFKQAGTGTIIQTGDLPASWFVANPANAADALITVTWNMPATSCKNSEFGAFGSDNTGSFTRVWEVGGEFTGFSWYATHDLAGLENHWHNFIACDGHSSVVGCSDARTISYSLSISGHCAVLDTNCATTGSISLLAIHDDDEVQVDCPLDCPALLSACMTACQAACISGPPSCSRCCECDCKDAIHEQKPACPAPQASCYAARPEQPACL